MNEERRVMDAERWARVEAQMHDMERRLVRIENTEAAAVAATSSFREQVLREFSELRQEFARYRGMVGGLLLAMTAVGALLTLAKQWLTIRLGWPT